MEVSLNSEPKINIIKNYPFLFFGLLFSIALSFVFSNLSNSILSIIFITSLPFVLLLLFNFKLTYSFIIISLFIHVIIYLINSSIWLTIFIPISFLICYKDISYSDFKLPITASFMIYLLTVIISLYNSSDMLLSIYMIFNLAAFAMVLYFGAAAHHTKKEVINYILLFLALNLLNSFNVLIEGLTTRERVFGFAGVMFVDYVGIAITINFVLLFATKQKRYKIILIITLITFIVALLVTQTRNAWVSTFLCLFLLMVYLIVKSKKFEIRKSLLILALVTSTIILSSLVIFVSNINPDVTERAEQTTQVDEDIDQRGTVKSSLVMRLFIWHTAYMAFLEHPVIGIGAYSFPFSSSQYYTIPRVVFKNYVKGRTPHITYLAVAVETGLIGLIGFLLFLIYSLKFSYDTIKFSKTADEKKFSLLLFWPLIYIIFSMLMTDAWLWGQGIILWGILLGLNMWNRKRLLRQYNNDLLKPDSSSTIPIEK